MALTERQQDEIVRLLERQSRNSLAAILRSVSSFLDWLADAVDAASELWRQMRSYAHDIWQKMRGLFV
jgi:hypothetical protein